MLQQEFKHRYVRLGMSVVAAHGVAIAAVEVSGAEVRVALYKIDENFTNFSFTVQTIFPRVLNSLLNVPVERLYSYLPLRQERRGDRAEVQK
jgi:hypothetical protein